MDNYPSLDEIKAAHARLADHVFETPVQQSLDLAAMVGGNQTKVFLKLELFQKTGTFKARGAMNNLLSLSHEQLARGVTAVSAGNHAIATAFAARQTGTTAKVVMKLPASEFRVQKCKEYGAEVIFKDTIHDAFDEVERIKNEEGRYFVHPFDGPETTLGTATCGFEFGTQIPNLDAVIVPIGGGGLCAGFACALKRLNPDIKVYGVEPVGAQTMYQSFKLGSPQKADKVTTIADSLAPPYALQYSFDMCRTFVDDIVLVDDDALKACMRLLFHSAKLAVEPAGASATAALLGPLKEHLKNKRVGLLICGSIISLNDYQALVSGD